MYALWLALFPVLMMSVESMYDNREKQSYPGKGIYLLKTNQGNQNFDLTRHRTPTQFKSGNATGPTWGLGVGQRDPCANYYCANNGTCVANACHGNLQYYHPKPMCQCAGSWQGERCDDNPCDCIDCNNGTCYSDDDGSPHCCCPKGCTGDTCGNNDNSSCVAANGECVADDGICAADRTLDIPCCNGNICCRFDPCDEINCNNGTCFVNDTGSAQCCCPEGCMGDTCADNDNSSCVAANGECVADDGTCAADRILDIPCCNSNICCRIDPCDEINCNNGTCFANDTGSAHCCCPEGCQGDKCADNDDSSCVAANGECVADDGTCAADRILDIPCCNGNICCRVNPCDEINCNNGTCFVNDTGSAQCCCPEGCTGSTCADNGNPCDSIDCNNGTCYANDTGSTICVCLEGCTGANCELDDTACKAAGGDCLSPSENGTCGVGPMLYIPCCGGKICCQNATAAVVCEESTMTLSCDPGQTITINTASFGRDDFTTCPHTNMDTDQCSAAASLSTVQTACDGQSNCSVIVNTATFGGDPCPGNHKFLRVLYWCE